MLSMQKTLTLFLIISTLVSTATFGQDQYEYRFCLNSGMFNYTGKSATKSSYIVFDTGGDEPYTNNPYSSNQRLTFGFSIDDRFIFSNNFIIGAELGIQLYQSKVLINQYYNREFLSGRTYLNTWEETFFAYIGKRIEHKKIKLDFLLGFDFDILDQSSEDGSATSAVSGQVYKTKADRKDTEIDFRPRIQLNINYKHLGIYAGYSRGLSNYMSAYSGQDNSEAYTRIIRFGVTYHLF
jgi:hypothetical protein